MDNIGILCTMSGYMHKSASADAKVTPIISSATNFRNTREPWRDEEKAKAPVDFGKVTGGADFAAKKDLLARRAQKIKDAHAGPGAIADQQAVNEKKLTEAKASYRAKLKEGLHQKPLTWSDLAKGAPGSLGKGGAAATVAAKSMEKKTEKGK